MKRLDTRALRLRTDEILGFACVRNERLRLPWFLEYHRRAGVDRFFIVDNSSTDGTTDYLLNQPDVTLYFTEESYAASLCGLTWMNELLELFAVGHWALTLDADEILVYPGCERTPIRTLTQYLESQEADALQAMLLDMYSDRPISETSYSAGEPFFNACPFFDADTYTYAPSHPVAIRGGPRQRVFWDGERLAYPAPFLAKVPLVRWRAGLSYEASTHEISNTTTAEMTGALLHFKFFDDFPARASIEAERKEHFREARQYVAYDHAMCRNPRLTLHHERSVRYENSRQLISLGLLRAPDSYLATNL